MTTAWTPSTEYGGCCGIYDSMNTFHWIRWMLWYIWRQHEHLPLNTVDAVVYMTTAWTPSTEYGGCCGIYDDSMNTFHWIRWMLWYIWRQHEHLPLNTVDAVVYITTTWTPSTEYGGCCGIYDDSMNTFHWIRWMLWYIWRQHEHLPLNTVDAVVYMTTAWTPSTEYGGCCGIYDDSMNTFHWIRWMLWYISRQHEHLPLNTVDAVVYMTTAWTPSTEYGGCCGIYDDSMNTFLWIRWMLWYIWRQHEHLPLNTVDAVVYMTTAWTPSTEYGGCCGIYDDSMNTFHWIRWMLWYIWRQHEHLPLNTVDAVVYMTTAWTPSTEYGGCCGIYDDSMNTFHWIRWMLWYIWRQHEHLPLNTVDAVVYITTAWTPSTEYGGCCGIYDDSMNTFHWIRWMLWYIWRQHEHLPLNTVDAVVYITTAWTPSTEYGGCCGGDTSLWRSRLSPRKLLLAEIPSADYSERRTQFAIMIGGWDVLYHCAPPRELRLLPTWRRDKLWRYECLTMRPTIIYASNVSTRKQSYGHWDLARFAKTCLKLGCMTRELFLSRSIPPNTWLHTGWFSPGACCTLDGSVQGLETRWVLIWREPFQTWSPNEMSKRVPTCEAAINPILGPTLTDFWHIYWVPSIPQDNSYNWVILLPWDWLGHLLYICMATYFIWCFCEGSLVDLYCFNIIRMHTSTHTLTYPHSTPLSIYTHTLTYPHSTPLIHPHTHIPTLNPLEYIHPHTHIPTPNPLEYIHPHTHIPTLNPLDTPTHSHTHTQPPWVYTPTHSHTHTQPPWVYTPTHSHTHTQPPWYTHTLTYPHSTPLSIYTHTLTYPHSTPLIHPHTHIPTLNPLEYIHPHTHIPTLNPLEYIHPHTHRPTLNPLEYILYIPWDVVTRWLNMRAKGYLKSTNFPVLKWLS